MGANPVVTKGFNILQSSSDFYDLGHEETKKKTMKNTSKAGIFSLEDSQFHGGPGGQLQIKKLRNVISEVVCSLVSSGVTRVEA